MLRRSQPPSPSAATASGHTTAGTRSACRSRTPRTRCGPASSTTTRWTKSTGSCASSSRSRTSDSLEERPGAPEADLAKRVPRLRVIDGAADELVEQVLLEILPEDDRVRPIYGEDRVSRFERFVRDAAMDVNGDQPRSVVQDLRHARPSLARIIGPRAPFFEPIAVFDVEDPTLDHLVLPLVHRSGRIVPPLRKPASNRQTIHEELGEVRGERGAGGFLRAL